MSKSVLKKVTTYFFIVGIGLFIGYQINFLINKFYLQNGARNPASINTTYLSQFKGFDNTEINNPLNKFESPLVKVGQDQLSHDYFKIHIKNLTENESSNGYSTLEVTIVALKNLPEKLSYKWILEKDLNTNDELSGEILNLKANETKTVVLNVYGFNKNTNSYISFLITGKLNNHKVRREVLVSSRPEDSFEYLVRQNNALEKQDDKNEKSLKTYNQNSQSTFLKQKFRKDKLIR